MFDLDKKVIGKEKVDFSLKDAEIIYFPNFISTEESDELFQYFLENTKWQHDAIKLFGKTYMQPRLTALYGINNKPYSYSGIMMKPFRFDNIHHFLLKQIETITDNRFTTILFNLYRDGNDSNGWHADDEKELGNNPVIASLSLGAERIFQLKHTTHPEERYKLCLNHGSLLVMKGSTQEFWKHQIPKTKKEVGPRINLTFRKIN